MTIYHCIQYYVFSIYYIYLLNYEVNITYHYSILHTTYSKFSIMYMYIYIRMCVCTHITEGNKK